MIKVSGQVYPYNFHCAEKKISEMAHSGSFLEQNVRIIKFLF